MKKSEFIILNTILILVCLLFVQHTEAGMINYERRNKKLAEKQAKKTPAKVVPQQDAQTSIEPKQKRSLSKPTYTTEKNLITKIINSNPRVTTQIERMYDRNRDGRLNEKELQKIFDRIISTIERKGNYTLESDLLTELDKNKDGKLTRFEINDLKKYRKKSK